MKKSQTDRAIESLEGEIKVLQMAVDRLKQTQAAKPTRVRKTKPVEYVAEAVR